MGILVDSDEHRALRESVRKIADKYGHDYFARKARSGEKLDELMDELGSAGFLSVHLSEEYGGGGGGLGEYVVVLEELAAHGIPLLLAVVGPAICGSIIAAHGSDEMKGVWLPKLGDGSALMSFAITESDAGSNSHAVVTSVRQDGEGFVLNGNKAFITGFDEADAVLVVARDGEQGANGRSPLSLFVVPTDAAGLSATPVPMEMVTSEQQFMLFFDEVRLGPESLIGERGKGLRQVFSGLNPERILASALSNGIGRYAVAKAADYAKTRTVWSQPIGSHQGVSHPIAESHVAVELARLATAYAANLFDTGQDAAEAGNVAKLAAADASLKALDQAIQTHGGNGLTSEYGLADLWFVARLLKTAPVSREMVLNFVAQHSLGLPSSY